MIRRHVALPAGPAEVWRAVTDPEILDEWFGAEVHWDLAPGAPARFDGADGDRAGIVAEVEPGRRLRFLWWPEDDEADVSEVDYELTPTEGGTAVTVTERRVPASAVPAATPRRGDGATGASASAAVGTAGVALAGGAPAGVAAGSGAVSGGWGPADQAGFEVWAAGHALVGPSLR